MTCTKSRLDVGRGHDESHERDASAHRLLVALEVVGRLDDAGDDEASGARLGEVRGDGREVPRDQPRVERVVNWPGRQITQRVGVDERGRLAGGRQATGDDSADGRLPDADRSVQPEDASDHNPVSRGPIARLEDDHRRLGRPPDRVRVEPRIDRDPALPQPITLLPRRRRARTNRGSWCANRMTASGCASRLSHHAG